MITSLKLPVHFTTISALCATFIALSTARQQTRSCVPQLPLGWTIATLCSVDITAKNITRLQRVQNSLARVVCCAPYRSPSRSMLQSLHWLPIEYRIQHKIATLTFKVRFHHQPNYLHQLITTYTPSCLLRSSDAGLLVVPRTSTTTAACAFCVAAPRIWNSLPEAIRSATSVA